MNLLWSFLSLWCLIDLTCASSQLEFPLAENCRGEWVSQCLALCDQMGEAIQTFHITQPARNGGTPCRHLDGSTRVSHCTGPPCPVDCIGKWSEWSCNAECDHKGLLVRSYIVVQVDTNGGTPCEFADGAMEGKIECAGAPCTDSKESSDELATRSLSPPLSFMIYVQPMNLSSFDVPSFLRVLFPLFSFANSTYSISSAPLPGDQFGLYISISIVHPSSSTISLSQFNETLRKLNQSLVLYEHLIRRGTEKEEMKQADIRIRQPPLFWPGGERSDLRREMIVEIVGDMISESVLTERGNLDLDLDLDSMMESIIHAYDNTTKCRPPPPMTYTDSVAVLVVLIVCGGGYFWIKFLNSLSHSEDASTPLVWVIFTLVMTFGSFMVLLIAEALPNWSRLTPGATFSPWKICPDDTACLSTINYGCPISTNAGGEALQTTRVTSVIAVLSLAAASIFMILASIPKFFRLAPYLLIGVQYTSLAGAITSLIAWSVWAAYSVDVIATLPGNLSLGEALILNLAGFCGAVCAAYFAAYSRKAILNKIAKNAARSQDEARGGSSAVPLVATNQIPSTSDTTSPQSEN